MLASCIRYKHWFKFHVFHEDFKVFLDLVLHPTDSVWYQWLLNTLSCYGVDLILSHVDSGKSSYLLFTPFSFVSYLHPSYYTMKPISPSLCLTLFSFLTIHRIRPACHDTERVPWDLTLIHLSSIISWCSSLPHLCSQKLQTTLSSWNTLLCLHTCWFS